MFTHILVPLDGSVLAEAVLPYVRLLAGKPGGRVTLLHLIERAAPQTVHGAHHLRTVADAEEYLAGVARDLAESGVTVETHIDTNEGGDTPNRIESHATEWRVDLVALCVHGRSGLGRLFFGSIAQSVLGAGVAPVLLVIAPGKGVTAASAPTLDHLFVPLDGTPEAEVALPLVVEIARERGSTIHLTLVVPTRDTVSGSMGGAARFSPTATAVFLTQTAQDAEGYLNEKVAQLRIAGVAVQAEVQRGDPATGVLAAAKRIPADLTAVASHGRSGLEGAWMGSVGNTVLARAAGPFLLVRRWDGPR